MAITATGATVMTIPDSYATTPQTSSEAGANLDSVNNRRRIPQQP